MKTVKIYHYEATTDEHGYVSRLYSTVTGTWYSMYRCDYRHRVWTQYIGTPDQIRSMMNRDALKLVE